MWHDLRSTETCPICGHKGWCAVSDDGTVYCHRKPSPHPAKSGDGWIHFPPKSFNASAQAHTRIASDSNCRRPREYAGDSCESNAVCASAPDGNDGRARSPSAPPPLSKQAQTAIGSQVSPAVFSGVDDTSSRSLSLACREATCVPTPHPLFSIARTFSHLPQDNEQLFNLACVLGVSPTSLASLDVRWDAFAHAWAFPMRDASGIVVGIRYRSSDGSKWSARGSHDGLFIPVLNASAQAHTRIASDSNCRRPVLAHGDSCESNAVQASQGNGTPTLQAGEPRSARKCRGGIPPVDDTSSRSLSLACGEAACVQNTHELFICEGPSDTAAALTLGLPAIGRSSCTSGTYLIQSYIRLHHIRKVTIIADNDTPGTTGARALKNFLLPTSHSLLARVVYPPPGVKDLRAYLTTSHQPPSTIRHSFDLLTSAIPFSL